MKKTTIAASAALLSAFMANVALSSDVSSQEAKEKTWVCHGQVIDPQQACDKTNERHIILRIKPLGSSLLGEIDHEQIYGGCYSEHAANTGVVKRVEARDGLISLDAALTDGVPGTMQLALDTKSGVLTVLRDVRLHGNFALPMRLSCLVSAE